jgi:hypothetical protein
MAIAVAELPRTISAFDAPQSNLEAAMYDSFHLADTVCPTLPRLQIERPPVLTRR